MNVVLICRSADPNAESWPPKDDNAHDPGEDDPNYVFTLPESPWTYENESLNPNLQPHNPLHPAPRRRKGLLRQSAPVSSVPPYHPDYRPPGEEETFSDGKPASLDESSSEAEDEPPVVEPRKLVRRGSEGYEVHTINREAMLRQHVTHQLTEPGRYNVYVSEDITPSESDDDTDVEEEELPLAQRVEEWRVRSAVEPAT